MIRFKYEFRSPLKAMLVTLILEDTIKFFQLMWGYTESGEEQCLVKYPIGSIVSLKSSLNVDYMVDKYVFMRPHINSPFNTPSEFSIRYQLICIENDVRSGVIRYGEMVIAQEDDICPSRTNNLNIILN
jgi:hypothetical protein